MKYIMVSIYDSATEIYMRPAIMQSRGQATRFFEDEIKRPESELGRHPEDYALFEIGAFNDNDGKLDSCHPHCLAKAHEILALSTENPQTYGPESPQPIEVQ